MSAPAARARIVIYRLGSLGDTVVALPCLHAIARAFPDAERVLLTNIPVNSKAAPLEAILGGSGLVHRFMAYPVGTRSFGALRALRARLRALDTDTLVYLTPPRGLAAAWRDRLFFRLCGFSRIIGLPLDADLQASRRYADGTVEPECERLARSLAALGPVPLDDPGAWDLHLDALERRSAAAALGAVATQPRIAINMGGKNAANDWGEANWLALLTQLRETHADHALVIVGAAEDSARAERVGSVWPAPFVNLCGKVSPRVSAAALAGSRLFIGHDSGPLHLSACMRVPCVGLFGGVNLPRQWHPYGRGHIVLHQMGGMATITVDAVLAAARAQLDGAGPAAAPGDAPTDPLTDPATFAPAP